MLVQWWVSSPNDGCVYRTVWSPVTVTITSPPEPWHPESPGVWGSAFATQTAGPSTISRMAHVNSSLSSATAMNLIHKPGPHSFISQHANGRCRLITQGTGHQTRAWRGYHTTKDSPSLGACSWTPTAISTCRWYLSTACTYRVGLGEAFSDWSERIKKHRSVPLGMW